jgi:thiamine-monophosphate kinase
MPSEFDLIADYFTRPLRKTDRLTLGIGDDCALLTPSAGTQLAVSTDMLVEGRHFFPKADPHALGHKCLAVNLSDLAAMGARPLAFTLALALPTADSDWLRAFSRGMFALADEYDCELIGGDTTKGPLNICITVFGEVRPAAALRRDAAKAGDDIWVSGTLGDARLALAGYRGECRLDDETQSLAGVRMHAPIPRVALGLRLCGVAHAAIDISDGLIGDLQHILDRSRVGASLLIDQLPVGAALARQSQARRRHFTLAGGDDYELCFTAAPDRRDAVLNAARDAAVPATRIGNIEAAPGLRLSTGDGQPFHADFASFDHFLSP